MAQQTAVEWLIKKLESQYIKTSGPYDVKIIFGFEDIEQAKAMEKEQMKESYTLGVKSGWEAHECKTKK